MLESTLWQLDIPAYDFTFRVCCIFVPILAVIVNGYCEHFLNWPSLSGRVFNATLMPLS